MERKLLEQCGDILREPNQAIDRRLVVTFLGLLMALIPHRHRNEGGWISQLGSYLVPHNAEAGKKRIQKLLYSRKWDSTLLVNALWQMGEQRVTQAEAVGDFAPGTVQEALVFAHFRTRPHR